MGVHGTMIGALAGTVVVGDDVRKTLAATAMIRAAVLVPTLALFLPNDTRPGYVDADEGRTDTG